jgi:hypothetical protein
VSKANPVRYVQKVTVEANKKAAALMMIKLIGLEFRSAEASAAS